VVATVPLADTGTTATKGATVAGIMKTEFRDKFIALIAQMFDSEDISPEVGFTTTDEGHLIIEVDGLTIDDDGHIVPTEREFEFSATVEFAVTGTVTAKSTDAAREALDDMLEQAGVSFGYGWALNGIDIHDSSVNDSSVDDLY
jgi:hypothetical protein